MEIQRNRALKRVRRRLVLIGFLLQSLSLIVSDFGGRVNFFRWSLVTLRAGGPRHWIGLLVTHAARLRRHDISLYEQWRRNSAVDRDNSSSDEESFVVLSIRGLPFGVAESFSAMFPGSRWIETDMPDLRSTIDSIESDFVTVVTVACEFEKKWFYASQSAIAKGSYLVYADHDSFTGERYHSPFFKPDFSPYIEGEDRMYPFFAIGKRQLEALLEDLCVHTWADFVQLIARESESGFHIPEILAHLRQSCSSGGSGLNVNSIETDLPDLSIIIPTRDHLDLLRPCVESIRQSVGTQKYEIVILNNNSSDSDILEWFATESDKEDITIIDAPIEFNWSRLNNIGRQYARGRCLVFMNNDVEIISNEWGKRMATIAQKGDVGAVGPLLLYSDQTIQHAGVVIGFGGYADHIYSGANLVEASDSCFVSPTATRSVSAVTGACLMTMTSHFDALNGFDEDYQVAGDVDYCLRLRNMGLSVVFDGRTMMYHYESKTRRHGLPATDASKLARSIDKLVPSSDPFYNRNLTLSCKFPLFDLFEQGS